MSTLEQQLGTVIRGVGVSSGIVLGNAVRIDRSQVRVERVHLPATLLQSEISRLHDAIEKAETNIDELHKSLAKQEGTADEEHLGLLNAHKAMLRDQMLVNETEEHIRKEGINAEWALSMTLKHIDKIFERMEDPFFRERGSDITHVGELLMRTLLGQDAKTDNIRDMRVPPGSIVVASTLSPAEAIALGHKSVGAFVMDQGTATCHTAIIAKSLGIPAVLGLNDAMDMIGNGDRIIVDGDEGEIIIRPSQGEEVVYERRARRARAFQKALRQNRSNRAVTPDGVEIALKANLDFVEDAPQVAEFGGVGVGLFRTEFLFLDHSAVPTEEEQFNTYKRMLEMMAPHPVTIRTLDLGGDKVLPENAGVKMASAGLRAVRFCLKNKDIFKSQLRAMYRAAAFGDLRILVPFISCLSEVLSLKRIMQNVRKEMISEGLEVNSEIPLGVMIEVPAAAIISDWIATETDFLSIGTNDLIQYTLAVSRDDASLDYLYHPLHPAMLRLMELTCHSASKAGIPVTVCGEMAGDPRYTLVLIALGITELSMNPRRIPMIKEVILRSTRANSLSLLKKIMTMSSVAEITDHVDSYMIEHFSDLVTPKMRGAPQYAR